MATISLVTPTSYNRIKHLEFNTYLLLYLDKDSKLKRAIPDFKEKCISCEHSLIEEAYQADKVATFRLISRKNRMAYPVYSLYIEDDGSVSRCYDEVGNIVNLDNILSESKSRESAIKLLKKNM